jgi:hypothetical protein
VAGNCYCRHPGASRTGIGLFDLDEVMFFNRALSSSEVQSVYSIGNTPAL